MVLMPLPSYLEHWLIQMLLRPFLTLGGEMATAYTSHREAHRAQERQTTISLA